MSDPRVDINARCGMNIESDAIITQNSNFVNFSLASVNTADKLGYVSVSTTIVRRLTNISICLQHGNNIDEATADRVSETKTNSKYILNGDFETMR